MTGAFGYYDFFAGGGMAGIGLGHRWKCLFANDFSPQKAWAYRENFPPANEFDQADVHDVHSDRLPRDATLSWASFPCQDLSLAGNGKGLSGKRSGSFWGYWRLMEALRSEGNPVPVVVLENVTGAITARGGADFRTLLDTLRVSGYAAGPLVIDAVHFVPQSRPRLFIVAVHDSCPLPVSLFSGGPVKPWHTAALIRAYEDLPQAVKGHWLWWQLPAPQERLTTLADLIEDQPKQVEWHSKPHTERLLQMMSDKHAQQVRAASLSGRRTVGAIYKRIRKTADGQRVQRAEVRFDGVAGCLRTAQGGSSRQIVIVIEGDAIRTRLLSPREGARLMGLPEPYRLPLRYNEAFNLLGDGLAAPVVRWLEEHLLYPLALNGQTSEKRIVHSRDSREVIHLLRGA
jgi:DNA (cytosine-5)-methyltransferase 1